MKHVIALILFAAAAFAQNPATPVCCSRAANDSDMLVMSNQPSFIRTLAQPMSATDTSFVVNNGAGLVAPLKASIRTTPNSAPEIIKCSALAGNQVSGCTRGLEGTASLSWPVNSIVRIDLTAGYLNQITAEIKALESTVVAGVGGSEYGTGGGTAQAQTVTLSVAPGSLAVGLRVRWLPVAANTAGGPTLKVNGLGAVAITKFGTVALVAGDLSHAVPATAIYDGTEFVLQNPLTISGAYDTVINGGCVGAGDQAACFNAAAMAAQSLGMALHIPAGTWNILSKFAIPNSTNVWCDNNATTALAFNVSGDAIGFQPVANFLDYNTGIHNCAILKSGTANIGTAISLDGTQRTVIQGNNIYNFATGIDGAGNGGTGNLGVYFDIIDGNHLVGNSIGIYGRNTGGKGFNKNQISNNDIQGMVPTGGLAYGIILDSTAVGNHEIGNNADSGDGTASATYIGYLQGGIDTTSVSNWCEMAVAATQTVQCMKNNVATGTSTFLGNINGSVSTGGTVTCNTYQANDFVIEPVSLNGVCPAVNQTGPLTVNGNFVANGPVLDGSGSTAFNLSAAGGGLKLRSNNGILWSDTSSWAGSVGTGLFRNASGVLEINNGSLGTYRDLILRNLQLNGLAGNGVKCVHTDNSGNLTVSAADCGSGGSANGYTAVATSTTPTFTRSTANQEWSFTVSTSNSTGTLSGAASGDILVFNIIQCATAGGCSFTWPTGFSEACTIASGNAFTGIANLGIKQTFYWDGSAAHAMTDCITTAAAPGAGLLRGDTPNASELSGDCTTSGSNAIVCTKSNGVGFGSGATASFATNAQTATYTALAADFANLKTIIVASGTFTIALVANTSQPANGQYINIINYGTGVVTIARNGQNVNGGTSSLTLAAGSATAPTSAKVISNGTDYFASLGGASGGSTVTYSAPFWPFGFGNWSNNGFSINFAQASGRASFAIFTAPAGSFTVNKATVLITLASGTSCTGGTCGLIVTIYNSACTSIVASSTAVTGVNATGFKSVTFASPPTLTAGANYCLSIMSDSTVIALSSSDGSNNYGGMANLNANRIGFGTNNATGNGGSLTAPSSVGTLFPRTDSGGNPPAIMFE